MRPVRSLPSGIKKCIFGRHLPHWLGRCLTTEASLLSEDISKSFVTGPLTMLSEEEEMMKDTGKLSFIAPYDLQFPLSQSSYEFEVIIYLKYFVRK